MTQFNRCHINAIMANDDLLVKEFQTASLQKDLLRIAPELFEGYEPSQIRRVVVIYRGDVYDYSANEAREIFFGE